jgi:hypothetical protein
MRLVIISTSKQKSLKFSRKFRVLPNVLTVRCFVFFLFVFLYKLNSLLCNTKIFKNRKLIILKITEVCHIYVM